MLEYIGLTLIGLTMMIYGNIEKLLAWYLFGIFLLILAGGWLSINGTHTFLQIAGAVQILFGIIALLYAVI